MAKKVITSLDCSEASSPDFIPVTLLKTRGPKHSNISINYLSMSLKKSNFQLLENFISRPGLKNAGAGVFG